MTWGRTALVLLLLGATVGPLLDGLHTWSGATWYPTPQWLKSVWWCPPLFAFAAFAIGMGRLATERFVLRVPLVAPGWRVVAVTMFVFIAGYTFSGFSKQSEVLVAATLLLVAVVTWFFEDRSLGAILGALGAGFGGWLVEHTLVGLGYFFHRDTMLDGVALWIPPLYFTAAFAIGALAKQLRSSIGPPASR